MNAIIAQTIEELGADRVVWAPRGDGGHVLFRSSHWHGPAFRLIRELQDWASEMNRATDSGALRITAHVGPVCFLTGADGRDQAVGPGINLASWLLSCGPKRGVAVSAGFETEIREARAAPPETFHGHRVLRDRWGHSQSLALMSTSSHRSSWDLPTQAAAAAVLDDRELIGAAGS